MPISRTVEGEPLSFCPPAVLRVLGRGAWLTSLGWAALPVAALTSAVPALAPMGVALASVSPLVTASGAWLLASRTERPERARVVRERWVLRIATLVLTPVLAALVFVGGRAMVLRDASTAEWASSVMPAGFLEMVGGDSAEASEVLGAAMLMAAAVVWMVVHGLTCWRVAMLARRIPHPATVQLAAFAMLDGIAVIGFGVVGIGIGVFVSHVLLFFPLCLVIPVWIAGLIGFWMASVAAPLSLLSQVRTLTAARAGQTASSG